MNDTPQPVCVAMNLRGEHCQLPRGHGGWHEINLPDGRRTTWNYTEPRIPMADSERWRFAPPLTERQLAIIDLIRRGLSEASNSPEAAWFDYGEMAEELDMARNTLRWEVKVLCARYRCSMRELPAAVEREAA